MPLYYNQTDGILICILDYYLAGEKVHRDQQNLSETFFQEWDDKVHLPL